jgi:hypothetical protein
MNKLTEDIANRTIACVGTDERNDEDEPLIRSWLTRCGVPKMASWCAAFAWCMVDDSCKALKIKNKLKASASVHRLKRNALEAGLWTMEPEVGFVALHDAGKGLGHCGIVVEFDYSRVPVTCEGNTSQAGSRNGTTCLRKTREVGYWNMGYIDTSKLL